MIRTFRTVSRLMTPVALLLPVLTALTPAFAQVAPRARTAPPARTTPVRVPEVRYRERTLPNGLRFFAIEDHKSPTVAIQVWYRVGGKDDPEGRSGFAHLFEHMMFKSTRNMKSEMMDRLTEDVGGANNAYTADDRTVYHETVPSNYLETLLWAEADRMANLNVEPGNFASERAVVQEEFRQNYLSQPYGRLFLYVSQHSFIEHPYRRETIGSIADLEAATIEDVRRFHATYYRPDNAVLIVSGDFEPAKLDAWVDKYFGRIAKPEGEIPRVTVREPERTGEKRFEESGPNVPLPAVVLNYLVPPVANEDAEPLRIAEVILSRGESSRLYQSLVYRQQVASQADATADLRADAGLFGFTAISAGGKTLDQVEAAMVREIERLKADGVTTAELEKARNQLLADALGERETAEGRASALGYAVTMQGDPARVNTDLARLQAVTAADVRRVAQKYFVPENRVTVRYTNGEQEQGGAGGASSAPESATPPAPSTPTEQPPKPSAPRRVTFPTPTERTLPNGVRVIVVSQPGTGLTTVTAAVRAGGTFDPAGAAGLADFTASLLTRGTKTRSATQIAERIEALGGSIGSGAGWDAMTVSLSGLSARLDEAMPIFAEVVKAPAFRPDEADRLRAETIDQLTIGLRSPGTIARYAAARVVFGDTAYGHALGGTPESLRKLTPDRIRAFYDAHFHPRNLILVFGGDIMPERAYRLASTLFGRMAGGRRPASPAPAVRAGNGGRVVVIDKPDAGQAAVLLARPAIRREDPRYVVGRVANDILGGGFSSRLNQEIRIKRGLSYGAGSRMETRRHGGLFTASAQTRNAAVPEVATLLRSELARLASTRPPASEMTTRKAALSGDYARALETGAGLAAESASLAIFGLPLTGINTYLPRVQAVTPAEVRAFAATALKAEAASLVIVGDGRQFLPALRAKLRGVEVIPIGQLDLNRGTLKTLKKP
ncbi:MAG: pitrilysin family protein [Capsulimonadales bacterium]|nr:pitrilysin family protein [Capsulimonadales bacterium]